MLAALISINIFLNILLLRIWIKRDSSHYKVNVILCCICLALNSLSLALAVNLI